MAVNPSWLGKIGQALMGLLLPVLGQAKKLPAYWRFFVWLLHIALVLVILAALWYAGPNFARLIRSSNPLVQRFWLVILFLILYAMGWAAWTLWWLFSQPQDDDAYPDITEAWNEAVRALDQARLDVGDLPLFLVLGEPRGGEAAFFSGIKLKMLARATPADLVAPLHVCVAEDANRRAAIFVTCSGASLLGRFAGLLSGRVDAEPEEGEPGDAGGKTLAPGATISPGGGEMNVVQSLIAQTMHRPLTMMELGQLERVLPRQQGGSRPSVLKDPVLVKQHTGRLRHLCTLIQRSRSPRCPANGVLMMLPLRGTEGPDDQMAIDTGVVCRYDLAAVRETFHLHMPIFALLCDLETAPGYAEFVAHFSSDDRDTSRIGRNCPLVPRFPGTGKPAELRAQQQQMLANLASWVCNNVVLRWVYKSFQIEKAGTPGVSAPPMVAGGGSDLANVEKLNGKLFQFYDELRSRQERLGKLLGEALLGGDETPVQGELMFGGLYIAGTGSSSRDQAFFSGVLPKLIDNQNHVRWHDSIFVAEDDLHAWASRVGWLIPLLIVADCAAIAIVVLMVRNR